MYNFAHSLSPSTSISFSLKHRGEVAGHTGMPCRTLTGQRWALDLNWAISGMAGERWVQNGLFFPPNGYSFRQLEKTYLQLERLKPTYKEKQWQETGQSEAGNGGHRRGPASAFGSGVPEQALPCPFCALFTWANNVPFCSSYFELNLRYLQLRDSLLKVLDAKYSYMSPTI